MISLRKSVLALAVTAATVLGVSVAASAWWPERPTFTVENPATYVTFNSITNNPREGDERAFLGLKDASNTQPDGFAHKIDVKDGQEILVRMYVHNNAPDSKNGTNYDGPSVARNTKVRVWLPSVTDSVMRTNAYISADNATPKEVSDTADFYDAEGHKFSIAYVPGSAIAYNNAIGQAGMKLADSIVTTGAPIGYTKPDGSVPGCFQYVNVVTLKVRVKMENPGFEVTKKVAIPGQAWTENVAVNPGDTVSYQIHFKNTGNTQLDKVVVRDRLPQGVKIVPNSTKLFTGTYPNGTDVGNDGVVGDGGLLIGNYAPGAGAYVTFKATMPKLEDLACGDNKLINTAEVRSNNGPIQSDTASSVVSKKCQETQKPVYSCDLLELKTLGGRKISATLSYTAINGATFKEASYDFGDTTKLVSDKTTVEHTYAADGTYVVKVVPAFMVDGKRVTAESQACMKSVTFKNDQPVTPETPSELPNTGAGGVAALFAAVSVVAGVGYRFWAARRLS